MGRPSFLRYCLEVIDALAAPTRENLVFLHLPLRRDHHTNRGRMSPAVSGIVVRPWRCTIG